MLALKHVGHTVVAIAPHDEYADRIRGVGILVEDVKISGSGTNLLCELNSVIALKKVLNHQQIDLVLSYTPKGNLYSALSCLMEGIEFVPNVSGLGRVFIQKSMATWVAKLLYRLTFRRAYHVFFQNNDDKELFIESGLVKTSRCERLPGSGVDLQRFQPCAIPMRATNESVFILVARMLWDKGVGEYVEAARLLKHNYPKVTFRLLGFVDVANPSAIMRDQIDCWVADGLVEYLGSTDDVRPFLMDADCVVLPSYREGVPRTLLEAAAMARPLITTNAPGCRDTVIDGVTGFLCQPANALDLAEKMRCFIELPVVDREKLGQQARQFIVEHFDEKLVLARYLELVSELENVES